LYIATNIKITVIKKTIFNSSSRLISIIERQLTAHLQNDLLINGINITIEQWRTLFYLWTEDGINQQELALRAKKEKSTITRQIDALEKKKLIVRRSNGDDKRNKLIFLTEKGKTIESKALKSAQRITIQSEMEIDKSELAVFKKVLGQIIKNLD